MSTWFARKRSMVIVAHKERAAQRPRRSRSGTQRVQYTRRRLGYASAPCLVDSRIRLNRYLCILDAHILRRAEVLFPLEVVYVVDTVGIDAAVDVPAVILFAHGNEAVAELVREDELAVAGRGGDDSGAGLAFVAGAAG